MTYPISTKNEFPIFNPSSHKSKILFKYFYWNLLKQNIIIEMENLL